MDRILFKICGKLVNLEDDAKVIHHLRYDDEFTLEFFQKAYIEGRLAVFGIETVDNGESLEIIRLESTEQHDTEAKSILTEVPTDEAASSVIADKDKKTEELYKKVRGVLNKLTPQKFDTLLSQIKSLHIDTVERLQGVIDLVFEKAVDEPNFSVVSALMCKKLALMQVPTIHSTEGKPDFVNFRKLLITRCQVEFEKQFVDESTRKEKVEEIEACTDPDKKKDLQFELEEYDRRLRMKSVGNIRFIGELFKQNMLTVSIMMRCLTNLLDNKDEESLECLCKLLTTVGKELESKSNVNLSHIFNVMKYIVDKKDGKVSSRIRFMLQDVMDLRSNSWVPRRRNVSSDDDWIVNTNRNRTTQFTVQSDKLKREKAPLIDEPLASSQLFGSWGKGSIGSNIKSQPPSLGANTANMYAALENMSLDDMRPIIDLICEEVLPLNRLHKSFEILIGQDQPARLLAPLFKQVISKKGPNFLHSIWQASGLQLTDFMPVSQVDSFVKDNQFEFLVGGGAPVGQNQLTYEQIQGKLLEFLKTKKPLDDIVNWITANVGDRVKENPFIKALATAIFRDSINSHLKLVPETLSAHNNLLLKYVDNNPTYELQCLYALQALIHKLEHPQDDSIPRQATDSADNQEDGHMTQDYDTSDNSTYEVLPVPQNTTSASECDDVEIFDVIRSPSSSHSYEPVPKTSFSQPYEHKSKKLKGKTVTADNLLENASGALKEITSLYKKKNINVENTEKDSSEIFSNFVASKLRQIKNSFLRNDTELEIAKILYAAIKSSKESDKEN